MRYTVHTCICPDDPNNIYSKQSLALSLIFFPATSSTNLPISLLLVTVSLTFLKPEISEILFSKLDPFLGLIAISMFNLNATDKSDQGYNAKILIL